MKCDKCNQEIEGVYVGPGDGVHGAGGGTGIVLCAHPSNLNCLLVEWSGREAPRFMHHSNLRTVFGNPVLGFRDPRDERIKELEAEVAAARESTSLHMFLTKDELQRLGWVKLDDEAIVKIHAHACAIAAKDFSWEFAYGEALRDFRDGRLR